MLGIGLSMGAEIVNDELGLVGTRLNITTKRAAAVTASILRKESEDLLLHA